MCKYIHAIFKDKKKIYGLAASNTDSVMSHACVAVYLKTLSYATSISNCNCQVAFSTTMIAVILFTVSTEFPSIVRYILWRKKKDCTVRESDDVLERIRHAKQDQAVRLDLVDILPEVAFRPAELRLVRHDKYPHRSLDGSLYPAH